jgi:AraC family transcriptional regulator
VPDVVSLDKCRYDVGLEIPAGTPPDPVVMQTVLPEMLVAQVMVVGGADLEFDALTWLYRTWLPASGYVPAALPGFESWIGKPYAHGLDHFELHVQIPIRPPHRHPLLTAL